MVRKLIRWHGIDHTTELFYQLFEIKKNIKAFDEIYMRRKMVERQKWVKIRSIEEK
jgi:hypothetical protein